MLLFLAQYLNMLRIFRIVGDSSGWDLLSSSAASADRLIFFSMFFAYSLLKGKICPLLFHCRARWMYTFDVEGLEIVQDGIFHSLWLHNPLKFLRKTPLLEFWSVCVCVCVLWELAAWKRAITGLRCKCLWEVSICWWKIVNALMVWELGLLVTAMMKDNSLTHLTSNSEDLSILIYCIGALPLFMWMEKNDLIWQNLFSRLFFHMPRIYDLTILNIISKMKISKLGPTSKCPTTDRPNDKKAQLFMNVVA